MTKPAEKVDVGAYVDKSIILQNVNIWKILYNTETKPGFISDYMLWTHPVNAVFAGICYIRGDSSRIIVTSSDLNLAAYPAFTIDLSKIPFTRV